MAKKAARNSSAQGKKPGRGRPPRRKKSFRRRLLRWSVRAVILGAVALGGVGVLSYMEASTTLDQWLQGAERSVNPSYIYAAPVSLRVGQRIGPAQIVNYLQQASYVKLGSQSKAGRSSYKLERQMIEIMPGKTAAIVRRQEFPRVRISFDEREEVITHIFDPARGRALETYEIEPAQLSTITRFPGHVGSPAERGIRVDLSYEQIPADVVNAVIAIEDRSFFEHTGVSPLAILRALWRNLHRGRAVQGGSTITQQLVKNILVGPEKTYKRKLREAFIAWALERRLTKEEIFAKYANIVYMGRRGGLSIYGLGAAAREYLGKDIAEVTLPEGALLAGMIHRPAYYLIPGREGEAVKRRNHVLDAMLEQQMIAAEEAGRAKRAPLELKSRPGAGNVDTTIPYFMDYVQEQVLRLAPDTDLAEAGYRIHTTLDTQLQRAASLAVADGLAMLDRSLRQRDPPVPPGTVQAAMVALEARTGRILALVGGRDYSQSQFNRVTDALRQPGSAIKPFVYATALSYGMHGSAPITLATLYRDEPRVFEQEYAPKNFGDHYLERPVRVREALARSLNVVTVMIAQDVGYGAVAGMLGRCGLPRPPATASIALGTSEVSPLELASAYTAFVTGGLRAEPTSLLAIMDAHGSTLKRVKSRSHEVMSPQVAYLVLSALRDVIERPYGTGHTAATLELGALAGKTGTSQRSDAWFVGLTPAVVTVTWVGFDDNRPLGMTGSRAALPIWMSFMKQVADVRPDLLTGSFEPPEGLIERPIDPTTGMLATQQCPTHVMEFFLEGREVVEYCTEHPGVPLEDSVERTPVVNEPRPEPGAEPRRRTRPRRVVRPDGGH